VYVDDIILSGPNSASLQAIQTQLQSMFQLKILVTLKYFFGLEIAKSNRGISLSQRKYTLSLLEDTRFLACKPFNLPMDANLKLNLHDGDLLPDPSMYKRLIGRMIYLTISHLDITFAMNHLSQYMKEPRVPHLNVVHHLLQYLKSAPGQGLFFPAQNSLKLTAFVDADWASCVDTIRSTYGFYLFLGNNLLSWRSKKQPTVSKLSIEVEYRALSSVTSKLVWLRRLLLHFEIDIPSVMLFCDNKSTISLASNPAHHEQSKHIDIDHHFIREYV